MNVLTPVLNSIQLVHHAEAGEQKRECKQETEFAQRIVGFGKPR